VAAGVGALAFGVGLELLRRGVLTRLVRTAASTMETLPVASGVRDVFKPQNPKKVPRGYEVHETIVYMRRVIRRQE
jgi:hypothetical protein